MITYLAGVFLAFITYKVYSKLTARKCTCKTKLNNKVVIVTGSNTGIGFETAKDLARREAKVILACRDQAKGIRARDDIIKVTGNRNVVYKQLDLASFKSVRTFVSQILETETHVHILINNAGTGKLDNSLTEDKLPVEMQINHFGPFLLTKLLLPMIKSSSPSRIINVSSLMHRYGTIDLDNIHKPAKSWLQHSRVYSNSKLANVLFTKKLSRELSGAGVGVAVNCLHPGAVSTDIFRHQPALSRFLISLVFKTPEEGAQTTIHLAVSPELGDVTGKYFSDCNETASSCRSEDKKLADKLWELSDKLTKEK
ncbi:retinol dehydrogenase 11-like [Leguminivora glycinivorella]|uniref:retinol dehydrogenase 11-like n=1 Tax=Leguminivora glycinivorella TaxID=1035111 RepID=UPI00200EBFF4|nr:retinol dehydrogenase 11-like [Leguminivora glycinivorella]